MTDKDIIEMAQKAGLHLAADVNWMPIISLKYAEKFAELVAAHEREACAKVCDEMWHEWLDSPIENEPNKPDAEDCAKAIRARSEK